MALQTFQTAIALGVQADVDTINATIRDLSGSLSSTDGIVLGDRESGEGESGITLPQFTRVSRERADLTSFTQQANSFLRTEATSFEVAFSLQGNGASATPSAGEAKPFAGIDAIFQGAGLAGANGTSPDYEYTPDSVTTYLTIKLWDGDIAYVFKSCVIETLSLPFVAADVVIVKASIRVGEVVSATDATSFPTFTYGTQASLSAPQVVSAAFTFGGRTRFANLALSIANAIEEVPDSSQATGLRLSQTARSFVISGQIDTDDSDTDFEHTNLEGTTAPTGDATWRIGTAAGASDTMNGWNVEANNLQIDDYKRVRAGDSMAATITAHCTAATAATQFKITAD